MAPHDFRPPRITVLGSINMDLVVRCEKLPVPGETISAKSFREIPGGKGANQAVAAARAGGRVAMIGCVGGDGFGTTLLKNLIGESIQCESVSTLDDSPSGIAIVGVEDGGENLIMVVPGANGRLDTAAVARASKLIVESDVLMVQLETPNESVLEGIRIARKAGVKVMLDPAPARQLPAEMFQVDLICPNESEAVALVGGKLETIEDAERVADELFARGSRAVAITLGEKGTYLRDAQVSELIPSVAVKAVDTTAAGDAFAGALAVRWAEKDSLPSAIHWANRAGALAASEAGAQPSLPRRNRIDSFDTECGDAKANG